MRPSCLARPRGFYTAAIVAALAMALASCGAAQRAPDEPVTLGGWCNEVGATLCRATAARCVGAMPGFEGGCREGFVSSCLGGRPSDAPAGRVGADLDGCIAALESAACPDLGTVSAQVCALDRVEPQR